jgi:protein involved in polysaccharide export with SLBB domain
MLPPNSFLDPTKVGHFPVDAHEGGIRRILSPRETPPGLANATEPVPQDLVPVYDEYHIGPGDTVAVMIQDLLAGGQPFQAVVEVSALGEIRVPDLGSIKIAGLTEQEVEQELTARLKEGGLLPRPIVMVIVQLKRGRVYNVMGAVGAPGMYPIGQPDLRLLEAFGAAGDVAPTARKAYVIRRESGPSGAEVAPPAPPEEGWVIPPPVEEQPENPASFLTTAGLTPSPGINAGAQESGPASQPPTREELADLISRGAQTRPTSRGAGPAEEPAFPPIIFDPATGRVLEAPPEAPPAQPTPPPEPAERELEQPFDWENVEQIPLEQRVIAIDLTELRAGNPRYNLVVRNHDVINVPADTGVFYVMGEVNRPGVYAFGGREITVKQALAICGGFAYLAWPQRCELIRREPGTDKQVTRTVNLDAIFAGLEDDFYLRDDDVLNVGTHLVAPFLFVIRNSFRFTYGFGFVYDRNFADKDAYGAKYNPQILEEQRRAQRGLPF